MKSNILASAMVAAASISFFACASVSAEEADNLIEALSNGDPSLDFRYRLELVDQAGIANKATASTLRTRLGYETGSYKGLNGFIQFENVVSIGAENYNSTVNGQTTYPVVVDPPTTELNQLWLRYEFGEGFAIKAGREAINLANQRFIGTVGWRQNDQTYDNINIKYSNGDLSLYAAHVIQVNRIFSHKNAAGALESNINLFQADYKINKVGTISGYAYLVDFDDVSFAALSRNTFGARLAGMPQIYEDIKLSFEAEYAQQNEAGNNPAVFSTHYFHGSAGMIMNGWTAAVGWEKLGSDNNVGFATPLATLHKFNGWADKFLSTPANGLQDLYVKAGYTAPEGMEKLSGLSVLVIYHRYEAAVNGADYGSEIDWQLALPFKDRFSVAIKGAHYNADTLATDTDKMWFMLTARF